MRANMNSKHRWSSKLFSKAGLSLAAQEQWRHTYTGIALTLLITPFLLILITLLTDWDLQLADRAFDFTTNTFPLRHAWLTEEFNHVILKRVLTAAAVGFLLLVIWDFISPRKWSRIRRFQFRVVSLSAISIPAAISLIKLQVTRIARGTFSVMAEQNRMYDFSRPCPQECQLVSACRRVMPRAHYG